MVSGEFSLDSDSLTRGLWQLKEAGWFDTAKGFVFGRPCMFESFTDFIRMWNIGHKSP